MDGILELLDEDFFESDEISSKFLEDVTVNVERGVEKFVCDCCGKICKSKQGLARHFNSKHQTETEATNTTRAQQKLQLDTYRKFVNDSASKLAGDHCYSVNTRHEFQEYVLTMDEATFSYGHIEKLILDFDGNGEKFYPLFFDTFIREKIFPRLSKKCLGILGCEVSNHVLAHLVKNSSPSTSSLSTAVASTSTITLTEKEKNVVCYLSGYVCHTIYKRLRRDGCRRKSEIGEKYLSLLLAGKKTITANDTSLSYEKLVLTRDRGGLWVMENFVVSLFEEAERFFRVNVVNQSEKSIDCVLLVDGLMKNCVVLSHFSSLRSCSQIQVEKEISLNLLHDLLQLFIRARTFSYVKQKCDLFKMDNKKRKMRSLRTSIKKTSSSLDMGH